MPSKHHSYFKFLDWDFNSQSYQLFLNYEIESLGKVTEIITFPPFNKKKNQLLDDQINKACELIHLMCGVSYYKAGLAKKILFEEKPSLAIREFIEKTWKHGLAELAYENNVSLALNMIDSEDYDFMHSDMSQHNTLVSSSVRPIKSLVAIGGGKDSLVTIEELKLRNHDMSLFMVGGSKLIKSVANFCQLPLIQVARKIDSKLIGYNNTGQGFNGHVPITAINSAIAVLTALLFDFNQVVFSNERSADSANTTNKEGVLVNHQYSKSYEFEQDLSDIIADEIASDIKYFSQQRAYSELAILKKFSQYPQFFPVFSSCNRNFHIDGSHNKNSLWCCDCPKCRFVFLGLAPFIKKQELMSIFQHNLLDDESQRQGFEELLGIKGFKPFECVGEIQESQLAFNLIKDNDDWNKDALIVLFSEKVPETSQQQYNDIMQPKVL
ncbi:MAG: endonuclease domain-containing protein [Marinicellaceae bacterium]